MKKRISLLFQLMMLVMCASAFAQTADKPGFYWGSTDVRYDQMQLDAPKIAPPSRAACLARRTR